MTCCPTCSTELVLTATWLECPRCHTRDAYDWTCSECGQGIEGHSAIVVGPVSEWPTEIPLTCKPRVPA